MRHQPGPSRPYAFDSGPRASSSYVGFSHPTMPPPSREPPFTPSLDILSISPPRMPMPPHPFLTLPEVKKVAPISQLIESALSQNIPVIEEKDAMIGFDFPEPVRCLAPSLSAEQMVASWKESEQQEQRVFRQTPIRVVAVNTEADCHYSGPYREWLRLAQDARFSLLYVENLRMRARMDFTQRAVSFDVTRPYLALVDHIRSASLVPPPILYHDLIPGSTPGRWRPSAQWTERMTGIESRLSRVTDQARTFMSALCQAEVLPSDKHAIFVRHDIWMKALAVINRRFIEETEAFHQETAEEVQRRLVEMQAVLKYCTLLALDACAALGGVEFPTWPCQPRAMGTIFDRSDSPMSASELSYDALAHALTLERWGVRHWRVDRGNPRWAITADCPPLAAPDRERELQHHLDTLAKRKAVRTPFSYVTTEVKHCPRQEPHAFDSFNSALEDFVREQVLALLAPAATGRRALTFASFSDTMLSVLKGIWSGHRYEAIQHSGDRFEGALWQKMRVPFSVGAHAPLIKSFTRAPRAFYHPHDPLPTANSAVPFLIEESATGPASFAIPQRDSWRGLGVRLTGDAAILESELQIEKMKDLGLLAYRTKRDRTINRNVTPDNRELLLLVKTKQSEDNLCTFIRRLNDKIIIRTFESKDFMPIGYRGIVELGYLSELFAQGLNSSMFATLLARSPAPLVPEAADFSAKELVELWARMYSQDLLEYDRFPPHVTPVSTLKRPISLTEVSFKLDVLKLMCMRKPKELDDDEYVVLLRFGLLLPRITRLQDASFIQYLYHCTNPIYSKVLRFLATEVQRLANSGEATCVVLSGEDLEHRMGEGPVFFESVRWQPRHRREVILRLELDKAGPTNSPSSPDIDADRATTQDAIRRVLKKRRKKADNQPVE